MTDATRPAHGVSQAAEGSPPSRVRRGVVILLTLCVIALGLALALGLVTMKPIVTGHDVGSWFL